MNNEKKNYKQIIFSFLLLICIASLIFNIKSLHFHYPYQILENYAHIIIFIIVTLSIYYLVRKSNFNIWIAGSIAIVLALLTEIIQTFNSRKADPFDFLLDIVSIAITVLLILLKKKSHNYKKYYLKSFLIFFLLLLIGLFLYDIASIIKIGCRFNKMLPILSDFEHVWELNRWQRYGNAEITLSNKFSTHGKSCFKVDFGLSTSTGILLQYFAQDWTKYKYLSFDAFNPQDEIIELFIDLYDSESTNYTSRGHAGLTLSLGNNNLKIPLESISITPQASRLNLKEIRKVDFFLKKPQIKINLFLDYIRLE